MGLLIENQGGQAFVAPSMREVPLEANSAVFEFAEGLFAGAFDCVILLTGVGARALHKVLATRYPPDRLIEALRTLAVIARGPKPMAVLREWNVAAAAVAPEPNTWRELLQVMEGRPERRIAVQEYGKPNEELLASLRARGARVTPVRVYQWDLPEVTAPLEEAARRIAAGQADVLLLTTSIQVHHLLRVAAAQGIENQLREHLHRMAIVSIGPTTSEALEEAGFHADLTPSHPKMGFLVREAADAALEILSGKRNLR
ncbi:MAG: uroporphyrinogen-III synthase [Acidobacteria bacterium]|nr:uroporphyrinogen-III synthase [Acidobacteriota bacterium]